MKACMNSNSVAMRDAERRQIEDAMARFKAQGGAVTEVDPTARATKGDYRHFRLPGSIEGYPKKKKWRR